MVRAGDRACRTPTHACISAAYVTAKRSGRPWLRLPEHSHFALRPHRMRYAAEQAGLFFDCRFSPEVQPQQGERDEWMGGKMKQRRAGSRRPGVDVTLAEGQARSRIDRFAFHLWPVVNLYLTCGCVLTTTSDWITLLANDSVPRRCSLVSQNRFMVQYGFGETAHRAVGVIP